MKRITLVAALAASLVAIAGQGALAQRNAETSVYLPEERQPAPVVPAGASSVHCTFTFDIMVAAPFGVSEIKGTTDPVEFIVSSQNVPYGVFRMDEDCNILSSWSTASVASSNLGLAYDTNTTNTYWMIQNTPGPRQVIEYQMGTGVATGRNYLIDNFGVPGPLCTNDNSPNPTAMSS